MDEERRQALGYKATIARLEAELHETREQLGWERPPPAAGGIDAIFASPRSQAQAADAERRGDVRDDRWSASA